jgi:hypothetical protein
MGKPMRDEGSRRAIVCAILFAVTSCKPVTLTANKVTNPVLFGPVRALGSAPMDDGVKIREFVSEVNVSTTLGPGLFNADASGVTDMDWMTVDVRESITNNEDLSIVMTAIDCKTHFFYPLFIIWDHAGCKTTATVVESPLPPIPRLFDKPHANP